MPSFPLTPARRVVLLAGVPLTIAFFCWGALSVVAFLGHASYSVARTVAWTGGPVTVVTRQDLHVVHFVRDRGERPVAARHGSRRFDPRR